MQISTPNLGKSKPTVVDSESPGAPTGGLEFSNQQGQLVWSEANQFPAPSFGVHSARLAILALCTPYRVHCCPRMEPNSGDRRKRPEEPEALSGRCVAACSFRLRPLGTFRLQWVGRFTRAHGQGSCTKPLPASMGSRLRVFCNIWVAIGLKLLGTPHQRR